VVVDGTAIVLGAAVVVIGGVEEIIGEDVADIALATSKALLETAFKPWLVAVKEYPDPAVLIDRPVNSATPAIALRVVVPNNTAPLTPVPGIVKDFCIYHPQ
jgi:hypothetical protein